MELMVWTFLVWMLAAQIALFDYKMVTVLLRVWARQDAALFVLTQGAAPASKSCGTHVPRNRKRRHSKRRSSAGGGAPADKPKPTGISAWCPERWALHTRPDLPRARTMSNRQANLQARRDADKLARADGVTLVSILTPVATSGNEKINLAHPTNDKMSGNTISTRTSDSDASKNTTPPSSSGSSPTSTSSSPRVSGAGTDATNGSTSVSLDRLTYRKVSFKDAVVRGTPALDARRANILRRAARKVHKRTAAATTAAAGFFSDAAFEIVSGFDKFVINTKSLALTVERRVKGAAHKTDKTVGQWGSKVVIQAKDVKSLCNSKAGVLTKTFSKLLSIAK